MKNNLFIKILCSIPVILFAMYFSRFLGICLVIFRLIAFRNSKYVLPGTLVMMGIVLLIPKGLHMISSEIPYINDIVTSDIYNKLLSYSKFLLIFVVILMIVTYIINLIGIKLNNLSNQVSNYAKKEEQTRQNIMKENDMKMRMKVLALALAAAMASKICLMSSSLFIVGSLPPCPSGLAV